MMEDKVLDNEMGMEYLNNTTEKDFPQGFAKTIYESKIDKSPTTRMFDLCLYYLEGRQYLVYDRNLSRFVSARNQKGRNKVVINLVLNLHRSVVARLATSYPSIAVLPASPSYDDIAKAQASEAALRYYWAQENLKATIQKAVEWLVSCGNVGFHSYYDAKGKRVKTDCVSPYDLFFEKGATSLDESDWVAVRSFVKKSDLARAYPAKKKQIEMIASAGGEYSTMRDGEQASFSVPMNRIEMFEVYWKDGRHAILAGDFYLFTGEYPEGCFPVQHVRYTEIPNRLWGVGLVQPLIDLQNSYNKFRNQVLDNVELMSNPKWLIPKSAGVSQTAITNAAGEKVYYNPAGGKPEQVAGTAIPAYVLDNIQRVQAEMFDVSGIHSVSIGKRAVGVVSGKGIEALQQGDASQLQLTQQSMEDGIKKLAETVLVLMKTYYTKPVYMRMLDSYGTAVFKQIKDENIVDTPEVFIEANSLFRNEKPDRDAKIVEMLQLGLIDKEEAAKELAFNTGGMTRVLDKMAAISHAETILSAIIAGHEVKIYSDDDISSFKKVFGDYIKTDDMLHLPQHIQDYIDDVYNALLTQGMSPEQAQLARRTTVFPPEPQNPDQANAIIAAQASPAAGNQTIANVGNSIAQEKKQEGAQNLVRSLLNKPPVMQGQATPNTAEALTNKQGGTNNRMGTVGG